MNEPANTSTATPHICVGQNDLSLDDFRAVVLEGARVELDARDIEALSNSDAVFHRHAQAHITYGLNTGFGPMADVRISDADQNALQYNAIRSHAVGAGDLFDESEVRAVMLCRLTSLMKGYSWSTTAVVRTLADFLNHRIHPVIPQHGGVGASGDLIQLAHLGLALIGEGEVISGGAVRETGAVLEECGVAPLELKNRDGLAIMNGTSAMTGIGLANVIYASRLADWAIAASAVLYEIVEANGEPISRTLNSVKRHPGQQFVASEMERLLEGSQCVRFGPLELDAHDNGRGGFSARVQEHYSIRCVPQILGPIVDTVNYAREVLTGELNSVSDNPIFDAATESVYHGGNFHGDYVSLEMDKLKIVVAKLSMLCERQLNFLVNDRLNEKLPPFVNLGRLGLNLGMQGAQFTATSTTAENQTLGYPMYLHSIPTNKDNQDVVSMGTNAAVLAGKVIENAYQVLAIEMVTMLQAIDALGIRPKLAPSTGRIYDDFREIVPRFEEDTLKAKDLNNVRLHLRNNNAPK